MYNFVVISWEYFKVQHSEFWLNFEFGWNTVSGTGAWTALAIWQACIPMESSLFSSVGCHMTLCSKEIINCVNIKEKSTPMYFQVNDDIANCNYVNWW